MLTTSQFNWHPEDKSLSQEASSLDVFVGKELKLKSSHTNNVVVFKLSNIVKDNSDEDIYYWEYIPYNVPNNVKLNVNKVIIWND